MRKYLELSNARWPLLLAAALSITAAAHAQYDWTRNFRVGMQLGLNIRADFKTSGEFSINSGNPGESGNPNVNHEYDDGYVRVDETGNARGLTSYWGYRQGAIVDEEARTITFHSVRSFEAGGGRKREESPVQLGFDMAYGGVLRTWRRSRLGWELGVGILPISIKDNRTLSGMFRITPFVHPTDLDNLPAVPYEGGPSGIGPTIGAAPEEGIDTFTPGTIRGSRTLDLMLYNLRLGPTFYWSLNRRWALRAGAGPAIGILAGDYRFNETGVTADGLTTRNVGKFGKTGVVYGAYANALALFHLEPHGDLFAGVQFMSLTGSRFVSRGREAKLGMGSGVYFTAGVNWPF